MVSSYGGLKKNMTNSMIYDKLYRLGVAMINEGRPMRDVLGELRMQGGFENPLLWSLLVDTLFSYYKIVYDGQG